MTNYPTDEQLENYALKRIKICRECEHYKTFICTQCGCIMPFKVRIKNQYCPLKKWIEEKS